MTALRISVINGSPRPKGSTARVIETLLQGPFSGPEFEVKKLVPARANIAPCIHCDACIDRGYCIIEDDAPGMLQSVIDSDLIAVATPVYFGNVPADFKALIDRAQVFYNRRYVSGGKLRPRARRAIVIATCGSGRADMFDGIKRTMFYFFDALGVRFKAERDFLGFNRIEGRRDLDADAVNRIETFARETVSALSGDSGDSNG